MTLRMVRFTSYKFLVCSVTDNRHFALDFKFCLTNGFLNLRKRSKKTLFLIIPQPFFSYLKDSKQNGQKRLIG